MIDSWFFTLEEDVAEAHPELEGDALEASVTELLEERLRSVARTAPAFSQALRGYRKATLAGDTATAAAVIAWLGGQKSVAAAARRAAGVRGELDHFGALAFE